MTPITLLIGALLAAQLLTLALLVAGIGRAGLRGALLSPRRTSDELFRERLTNRLTEMLAPLDGLHQDVISLTAAAEDLSARLTRLEARGWPCDQCPLKEGSK